MNLYKPLLFATCNLCSWNSPDKYTGVGCHFLLQGIFLTQELNLGLLHCRQILYQLSYQGSPQSAYRIIFVELSEWTAALSRVPHPSAGPEHTEHAGQQVLDGTQSASVIQPHVL